LDPEYRGKGLGKEVLRWTIDKAKREGNSVLRLYTSPNEDLAIAQVVYDKFGFVTTKTEEKGGENVIYKELAL
jgi:ribosomal protein S18 acetylase RimI-like enzyme